MKPSALLDSFAPACAPDDPVRRQIVQGGRRHFLAHGFRGVTMDDLAGELGMSKKTLYAHFPSKIALVEAVLADKLARADADLKRIIGAGTNFQDMLRELSSCLQQHTAELSPPFVRDMRREAPEVFDKVLVERQRMIQRHFGKFFDSGRKQGMIRKDISTTLLIEILLSATQSILTPQRVEELGITPQQGLRAIITVILEGALTGRSQDS